MSFRFMRLIVFFDLPMESNEEKKVYIKFRKFLIRNGFIMMQKSVYTKLVLNKTVSDSVRNLVKKNKPKKGLLQILEITEKQFTQIEYLLGENQSLIVDSESRLIEI